MHIYNVRMGFATNSSSAHSIVFMRGMALPEIAPENNYFGWDDFSLVARQSKLDYLAAMVADQLRHDVGAAIAQLVANKLLGTTIVEDEDDSMGRVDHQSQILLPVTWGGAGLDLVFLDDFRAFLERDDIAVLGGTDDREDLCDSTNPLLKQPEVVDLGVRKAMFVDACGEVVARKDPNGFWVLFNRSNGTKLRIAFDAAGLAHTPTKAAVPELVDVKITNFCSRECSFCYQNSTPDGKPADKNTVNQLPYVLGEMRVFEVALGGGEPTLFPEFVDLVQSFRWNGVVPNFTTRNLAWLCAPSLSDVVIDHCGAFAFSAETSEEVTMLLKALKDRPKVRAKLTVQHIVGVSDHWDFAALLRTCADESIPITLLGYKTGGRGTAFSEKPNPKWLEVLQRVIKDQHLCVGIDTALVDKWWTALLEAGVPEWALTRHEGKFSCYLDATTRKLYPSSYQDHAGIELPKLDTRHFLDAYAQF